LTFRALVEVSDTHAAAQVRAALLRRGALLVEAPSVLEPSAYAPAFLPQLLVVDLTHEGLELAATLRGACGTSALFLTAVANHRLLSQCVEVDAAAVLMLPVDERQLAVTLQFMAAHHRLDDRTANARTPFDSQHVDGSSDSVPDAARRLLRPRARHLKDIFRRTGTGSQQDPLDWLRAGATPSEGGARVVPFRLSPHATARRLRARIARGSDRGGNDHAADRS
jgi:hypothetical protein